ncbi:histone H2A [Trifolium medium]|nr:histone H2A [Trifolium medium]
MGVCSSYVAELWGVYEGLKLAWERGYHHVELHVAKQGSAATGWSIVQNNLEVIERGRF